MTHCEDMVGVASVTSVPTLVLIVERPTLEAEHDAAQVRCGCKMQRSERGPLELGADTPRSVFPFDSVSAPLPSPRE